MNKRSKGNLGRLPHPEEVPAMQRGGRYLSHCELAFTRYCFTSKLDCGSQSSSYCPSLTCKAYPIAILLHAHCAIYAPQPTPLLYAIHHTILVMAISCKGQIASTDRRRLARPNYSYATRGLTRIYIHIHTYIRLVKG